MPPENQRALVRSALVFAFIYAVCTALLAIFAKEYATLIAPFVKLGFNLPQSDLIIERVEVETTVLKMVATVAPDGIFGALHGGRRLAGRISVSAISVAPVLVLTVVLGYPKCSRSVRAVWFVLSIGLILFITMIATPVLTVGKLAVYALKQPMSLQAFLAQSGAIPAASLGGVLGLLFASEKVVAWWAESRSEQAEQSEAKPQALTPATAAHAPRTKIARAKKKRRR